MFRTQTRIYLQKSRLTIFFETEIKKKKKDHPISARRTDLVGNKKKRTCQQVDFVVSADHRVINEGKRKTQEISGPWQVVKMLNMKVSVMPVVIGTLETMPNNVEKRMKNKKSEE